MKPNLFARSVALWFLAAAIFQPVWSAFGAAATVWHIPDNTSDLGFNMRNPELAIGAGTAVTFYTGVWKWDNGNLVANQTGGTLY